jgi:hypothetical protein
MLPGVIILDWTVGDAAKPTADDAVKNKKATGRRRDFMESASHP